MYMLFKFKSPLPIIMIDGESNLFWVVSKFNTSRKYFNRPGKIHCSFSETDFNIDSTNKIECDFEKIPLELLRSEYLHSLEIFSKHFWESKLNMVNSLFRL